MAFTFSDLGAALNDPTVKKAMEYMTREERIVLHMLMYGGTQVGIAKRLAVTPYTIREMCLLILRKINWMAYHGPKSNVPMPTKVVGKPGPKPKKKGPSIEEFNSALQAMRTSNLQSKTPQQNESVSSFLSRTLPQAIPENINVTYDKVGNVLSVTLTYSPPTGARHAKK